MEIDWTFQPEECVLLRDIPNKWKLMEEVIRTVPHGSVWSVEGVENQSTLKLLGSLSFEDGVEVPRGTLAPELIRFKVLLTPENKETLLLSLPDFDLERDFIHQYLYFQGKVLLFAGDNVQEDYTWLRRSYFPETLLSG